MRPTKIVARVLAAAVVAAPIAIVASSAGVSYAQDGAVYYVAPNGSNSAAGTETNPWASIAHAQSVAEAGDTVYIRGGTYAYTQADSNCSSQTDRVNGVTLNKSGSQGAPINYWAYEGETPVFDFSGMTDDCRIKGFEVTANWIHLKGLEITGVPQNNNLNAENWGVWISGDYNIFEQLNIHHIMGTGLFINRGGGNLVLNSDSHHNYDPFTRQGPGESADGFGSHYAEPGTPSNVFRGCRAWENADDGFDLISTYSSVIIEDSWSWRNGFIPETNTVAGNGAGFKIGGHGGRWDPDAVPHTITGSVAFNNNNQGFYANHHPVASYFYNNTAFSNRPNFSMRGINQSGQSVGRGILRNNVAYIGIATDYMNGTDSQYNSWDLGLQLSDADFQSVSNQGWDAPRQADGSLPELPHFRPAEGSALIDAGIDVGLPYQGAAPDLGAFQSGSNGGGGGGSFTRIQSYNYQDRFVRHYDFEARLDANVSPAADAQFRVVPGLANGSDGHVSFVSVNFPGYYLRHYGFDLVLAANDGSSIFAQDATFLQVAGLASSSWSSFRSYNYPDRHIRHYGFVLRIDPINDAQARSDATFRLVS